tara:strand:- start:214 stop:738 length:525 start_codon:yes stop_codon:yes gene_type:complete
VLGLSAEGKSSLLKGKIGESESYSVNNRTWEGEYSSTSNYRVEWDIEGKDLILYRCPTELYSKKCSGKTTKKVMGTHRTKINNLTTYNYYLDLFNNAGAKGEFEKGVFYANKIIENDQLREFHYLGFYYRALSKLKIGSKDSACSDGREALSLVPSGSIPEKDLQNWYQSFCSP